MNVFKVQTHRKTGKYFWPELKKKNENLDIGKALESSSCLPLCIIHPSLRPRPEGFLKLYLRGWHLHPPSAWPEGSGYLPSSIRLPSALGSFPRGSQLVPSPPSSPSVADPFLSLLVNSLDSFFLPYIGCHFLNSRSCSFLPSLQSLFIF